MNRFRTIRADWVFYFLISLAAGFLMVSSQSLWIDEGETLQFARQSSPKDWLATLLSNTKSEAHTPLGMFSLWLGARIFGESEWQLRILNALWVAIAGVAIGRLGRSLARPELLLLFLVQPFVWYYANEARVYALIICLSAWLMLLWALVHESGTLSTGRLWAIGMVATIGMATSLLFGFAMIGFGFAFGATMLVRKIRLERPHLIPIAATVLAMAPIMAYYVWTVTRGASAAKIWNVGLSNIAFAFYELLGFGGLGPARHELRELARSTDGLSALLHHSRYLIAIAILAAIYLTLLRPLWKLRRDSLATITAGAISLSTAAMFGASIVVGFPFWGRHVAYLLPLVVLLVSKATPEVSREWLRKSALVLLFVCLLASSLCQRFLPEYKKDDYRSASRTAIAALASGKTVWWVADRVVAEYYGLQAPIEGSESRRLIWFNNDNERDTAGQPVPDLIVVSKPDVHDQGYNVVSYIKEHGYRPIAEFAAFRLYTRRETAANTGSE